MDFAIKEGNYATLGVTVNKSGVTFTFQGEKEDSCSIILIHNVTGEVSRIVVPSEFCLGSLRSVTVSGIEADSYDYIYEINGKEVVDPYALALSGREIWNDKKRKDKEYKVYGRLIHKRFSWGEDKPLEIPKSQMVMYKLHVRGFSMGDTSGEKNSGTFAGVKARIPYLKDLGITTVEFMPVYEFEEMPIGREGGKINYWGYGIGNYFAVKASYAAEPKKANEEYKKLIKAFHEKGMECVMEIFFPEDTQQNLILNALHFWVKEYHVDGFHIIGGNIPVRAIVQDPVLSRTKIFMEDFMGNECNGRKYKNLFIYKEEYQYAARKILNHHGGDVSEFVDQQKKQSDETGFVNFITSNNGFTLSDLFMYNDKHNEANGEENNDGCHFNLSDNCGVEGPTDVHFVMESRKQKVRNAFMMLMFAQGIPLIWAGDEFGNSQMGNNNAYCQDNEIGWVDWTKLDEHKKEREFVKQLIAFRKQCTLITNEHPYRFRDYRNAGVPDISFHGEHAWLSWREPGKKSLGIMYAGAYALNEDKSDLYIGYNFYSDEVKLALPRPSNSRKKNWYLKMYSANSQNIILEEEKIIEEQQYVTLAANSICLLLGK